MGADPAGNVEQRPRTAWWLSPPVVAPEWRANGLSEAEARVRLTQHGPNRFSVAAERPLLVQFIVRFKNPLVIVLLMASIVSALTGELANFFIIALIVVLSVTLDFVQEYRAGRAAEKLRAAVSVMASVMRDGKSVSLPIADVVPGDIVLLAAGDLVPADGIVLEARDFFVKQALLTGEAFPVEKKAAIPSANCDQIESASNAAFAGTSVISGSSRVLVIHTGDRATIGAIAGSLRRQPPPTAFETGTRRFGMLIMRMTVLLVLFVLLVNALFHRPWLESFLFAVALAVGLTPELLPMVVSVTLSRGALRMADKRVMVKRLAAIQDLGSMNVLCTDKTGTLTEAKIRLERHVDCDGRPSERVLELAYLNSYFETGLRSPLDDAILEHGEIELDGWTKIDEVPFDFERRRVSVLLDNGRTRLLVVKGAPEDIIGLCTACDADGPAKLRDVDDARATELRTQHHALEGEGFRVLGIAWREVALDHPHAVVSDETGLVLAGFAAFLDPPKQSAGAALQALAQRGVAIKIVTGDSLLVTQHVCRELKVPVTGVLTGSEIAAMDETTLRARVTTVNLFCRVNPGQKERVLLALKARGNVVGYLGDGINDAPSLHSADVGISVDSAVDVAKEAADIILLEHDLSVLHEGVLEGRRTFANVMKYVMMGTSSNFGNMASMAGASLILPFLPMLPTQILLNNILYDISEIPIPLDRVEAAETAQPRALDMNFIRNFMLVIGPISSLFDFLTFYVLLAVLHAGEQLFQTGWFVESLTTQVLVIFVIRTRGSPLASRAHPALVATSLGIVATAALLPLTPLGAYFGFVPPPASFYAILALMVVAYLLIVEAAKRYFYRRFAQQRA